MLQRMCAMSIHDGRNLWELPRHRIAGHVSRRAHCSVCVRAFSLTSVCPSVQWTKPSATTASSMRPSIRPSVRISSKLSRCKICLSVRPCNSVNSTAVADLTKLLQASVRFVSPCVYLCVCPSVRPSVCASVRASSIHPSSSAAASEHQPHGLVQLGVQAEGPAVDDVVQGADEAEEVEQRAWYVGTQRVKQHERLVRQ